jgi:hypothetical protein
MLACRKTPNYDCEIPCTQVQVLNICILFNRFYRYPLSRIWALWLDVNRSVSGQISSLPYFEYNAHKQHFMTKQNFSKVLFQSDQFYFI